MSELVDRLLEKSQEAFILGIEIYNKPSIEHRLENICFLFCNAWELMLKAKLVDERGERSVIYYDEDSDRTLSLRKCLKKIYQDPLSPIRRNVEDISEIRDSAVHFVVPELESVYQGLLQSGVLNYVSELDTWFGLDVTDQCTPAMLSLVGDLEDVDPTKLGARYDQDVVDFVERETQRLDEAEEELNSVQYRIPVEYKLVLTKNSEEADISLTSGDAPLTGVVLEVPKDLDKTHPYRQTDAIEEINSRLPEGQSVNSYGFQAFLYKNNIKGQAEYHHKIEKPKTHRYSDKLIALFVQKLEDDPDYIDRARDSYSEYRKRMSSQ